MLDETDLCITCLKVPPHGYVNGTGEYLAYTCLPCHRRSRKQPNFVDGGDSKNFHKTPGPGNKEDK